MLSASGISVTFGGLHAISDVSFEVSEGEILGIIGPNGAGKTTLFNAVSGFVKSDTGMVNFDGSEVAGMRPFELASLGLVRTFQATRDFEHLTVREHIRLVDGRVDAPTRDDLLHRLGLNNVMSVYPHELPYGTRRDLGLVLALLLGPKCLLVDEPSSGLTDDEADRVAEILGHAASSGVAIAVIDHNVRFVRQLSHRILALNAGRIVATGSADEVLDSDEVRRVYLGA